MNLKFLFPLIGLILGIFLASEFNENYFLVPLFLGISLPVWLFIHINSRDPLSGRRLANYHFLWIIFLFAGIGSLIYIFKGAPYIEKDITGQKVRVSGNIEEVSYFANGDLFKIKIDKLQDSIGTVRCSNLYFLIKTNGYVGSIDNIISFEAAPHSILDYRSDKKFIDRIKKQGVIYYANVKTEKIEKIGETRSLFSFFKNLKEKLIILIEKSSLNRKTTQFLISILLGEKSLLSSESRQTLNSAGLSHILALSGMHVAIMLSFFIILLFPLNFFGYRKQRKLISIFLLWLYVILSGASPSTVRAAIMATFLIGAYILERKTSAFNALLCAVFLILMVSPLALWDIGLQLSFICVAAIIIFVNKLNPIDLHHNPLTYRFFNLLLTTIVTTLCTWAVIAYYFKNLPLLFLPSNILLLPLLPFFIGAGFLYVLLLYIGIDFSFLAKFLNGFHHFFIISSDQLSLSGHSTLSLNINSLTMILWLTGITFVALFIYNKNKRLKNLFLYGASFSILSSLVCIFFPSSKYIDTIKFQHSFTKMETVYATQQDKYNFSFPRQTISSLKYKNVEILAIDNPVHPDSLSSLKKMIATNRAKFLFVGSESDTGQIAELANTMDLSGIILHSGIGKNKKAELLDLLEEKNWDLVHSLGESGSLEFEL